MITYQKIKDHFDTLVAKGENAPSTARHYTSTIHKVLDDLGGLDDVANCCNTKVADYIYETYDNVGTRQAVFLSFLKAIDTYPDLQDAINPFVRHRIYEGYEASKLQARERAIQTQLTEKVERMDSIVAKIEKHFDPLSDEVLLINMYDEIALRKDFDDIKLVSQDPDETELRWINVRTGELVIKDFNKTNKRYGEVRHTLSAKMLQKIKQVYAQREYLLTLKTETLFKKMKSVVPKIGSQLLRKSKVSTETEGAKLLDPDVRHTLWTQMKHSPETQLTYRREIKE